MSENKEQNALASSSANEFANTVSVNLILKFSPNVDQNGIYTEASSLDNQFVLPRMDIFTWLILPSLWP